MNVFLQGVEVLSPYTREKKWYFIYNLMNLFRRKDKIYLNLTTSIPENISELSLQGNIRCLRVFPDTLSLNAITAPLLEYRYSLRQHMHIRENDCRLDNQSHREENAFGT